MAKRRKQNNSSLIGCLVIILVVLGLIGRCSGGSDSSDHDTASHEPRTEQTVKKQEKKAPAEQKENKKAPQAPAAENSYGGLAQTTYQQLANMDYRSGSSAYIFVNGDKSTLRPTAWQTNKVIYADLDSLNRTSHSNTAFLEQHNVANDSLRVRQFIEPTGWHGNHRGREIYNRGHLIAYSISAGIDQDGTYNPANRSGDQNNPKNLFTQTAYANQRVQTIFESQVRSALRRGCHVIYQATPIFRGQELMARGINLQAVATDGSLDFNVYIFNVQPNYVFNYADGSASYEAAMQVAY